PTLDNSNPAGANTWGGYCWGSKKLANGALPTQHDQASSNAISSNTSHQDTP
nr:hypothetical protein [Bacteroidota bacterium]